MPQGYLFASYSFYCSEIHIFFFIKLSNFPFSKNQEGFNCMEVQQTITTIPGLKNSSMQYKHTFSLDIRIKESMMHQICTAKKYESIKRKLYCMDPLQPL